MIGGIRTRGGWFMWKSAVAVFVVAVAALVGYASTRPDQYEVRRAAVIAAPPARIFPLVDTMANWQQWSPWEKLDSQLTRRYAGPPAGTGAEFHWEGNHRAGSGVLRIERSVAPSRIELTLAMSQPTTIHQRMTIEFAPQGEGTEVAWTMRGHLNLLTRVMGVFVKLDRAIGRDIEKALANLKALAEK